ncbi:GAF domain-containing protein [uncultured Secundilactobacillus sp.]|uniref:GAF domain-containing protein n=1 Tax=uncultured Secundilactobacillus sp. TaxID=2813935 RepID=UPI00258E8C0F|nr:GAF domain-containing protein [uncultured Secundilactobacillus sp.]
MTLADHDGQLNYQELVNHIYQTNTFDFVGLALKSDDFSRNIKWYFVAGNQSEQFRKIVLRSGIGIAGLVVRTGKPFWKNQLQCYSFTDAMYTPIARVESLTSAAAVPLVDSVTRQVNGVLLAGYRHDEKVSEQTTRRLSQYLRQ